MSLPDDLASAHQQLADLQSIFMTQDNLATLKAAFKWYFVLRDPAYMQRVTTNALRTYNSEGTLPDWCIRVHELRVKGAVSDAVSISPPRDPKIAL